MYVYLIYFVYPTSPPPRFEVLDLRLVRRPPSFHLPMSLLHVPSMMFSSIRNMCRPGKLLAQPRPTRSLMVDRCEYG